MGMQLIETIEVGAGGASSIEFTGIPQDGVDLVLVISARNDSANNSTVNYLRFNSDLSSTYQIVYIEGTGSAASSNTLTGSNRFWAGWSPAALSTANTFGNHSLYISNYTSNTTKTASIEGMAENNATASQALLAAASFASTASISSIFIGAYAANFVEHSTASLYKIY